MLFMSIFLFRRTRATALGVLMSVSFAFGIFTHSTHAMDAGVYHDTHASGTTLDCAGCSGARSLDCLKHCLEQTDATAQTHAPAQTLLNSAVIATVSYQQEADQRQTSPRIEHETRGSPAVILKTQKRE